MPLHVPQPPIKGEQHIVPYTAHSDYGLSAPLLYHINNDVYEKVSISISDAAGGSKRVVVAIRANE